MRDFGDLLRIERILSEFQAGPTFKRLLSRMLESEAPIVKKWFCKLTVAKVEYSLQMRRRFEELMHHEIETRIPGVVEISQSLCTSSESILNQPLTYASLTESALSHKSTRVGVYSVLFATRRMIDQVSCERKNSEQTLV